MESRRVGAHPMTLADSTAHDMMENRLSNPWELNTGFDRFASRGRETRDLIATWRSPADAETYDTSSRKPIGRLAQGGLAS